jgi:uncharacterized repeat protein (TIGR02543 family)
MKRRLIAGFLTLCMIVSLCPPSAFAVHSSASEMTEPETVVTEPAADTGAPEETAAPDPVPSEPQKEAEPTQPEETLPEGTQPEGTLPGGTLPAQTQPAQTQPAGTLPEGEEYSYRSVPVGHSIVLTTGLAEGGSWTSDNLAAATVTSAEGDTLNATVYGVAAGVTTVTYAADGAEERWVVYVNDPAVQTGETTGETVAAEAPADSEQATVEDQSQGGSVLDKLGNLLTGNTDTLAQPSAGTNAISLSDTTVNKGDTTTLNGSSNSYRNCSYQGEWTVDDATKATISGTGTSATLTGLAAGTVKVTHKYCNNETWHSEYYGSHTYETETAIITVVVPPLTGIAITGGNDLMVGVPAQLTAELTPAGAEPNLRWSTANEDVITLTETGLVTGLKIGTAEVTVTDTVTNISATYTVKVVREPVQVTSVTLTGVDTMTAFTNAKLDATVEPANADVVGSVWESSSEEILTVDQNGNVTAVAPGEAEIRYTVTPAGGTSITKTHKITVTAPENSTDSALFYYLIDPDGDPKSNTAGWGTTLGEGTVNMEGAQWQDSNKNCYGVSGRIISWPSGYENGNITRGDSHWTAIFDAYKSKVEKDLGVTITEADVEYIHVHPFKISRNNASNPDKHVDCTVEVKTKSVYTAVYKLWDAGDTGYVQQAAKNYKAGATTAPGEFTSIDNLPPTKTDANGVTYTFDGWYTNETRTGSKVTFPYTLDANTTFYAKYVAGYFVTYNLNGGSWNQSGTSYRKNEGSIVNIISEEPTRPGYKFTGWTSAEISADQIKAGTFTMPAKNVTLTAQWEKSTFNLTVNYVYEDGSEAAPTHTEAVDFEKNYNVPSPSITGYTPNEEVVSGKMPAEDVTVTVTYRANSYKVTYNYGTAPAGASTLPPEQTHKYNESVTVAPAATAPGYTFVGWNTDDATITGNTFTMPAKDVTLTGEWKAIDYTVLYEDYDGTKISEKTYHYGDAVTVPANPTRAADEMYTYEFAGWVKRDGIALEDGKCVGDVTYIATYTQIYINYTVTYTDGVDGEEVFKDQVYNNLHYEDATPKFGTDPVRTGYTFMGWNPEVSATVTGTVTYVARWEKDESQIKEVRYTVEHKVEGVVKKSDTYTESVWVNDPNEITVRGGTLARQNYTGYKFDSMTPETTEGSKVASDSVIILNYVKDDRQTQTTKYTVRYTINDIERESFDVTGTAWINDNPAMIAIAQGGIPAPADKFPGYRPDPENPIHPAAGTLVESGSVYTVNYVARDDTAYKVEHYQQNLADDEYTLTETDNPTGTTGELTKAAAKDYPGFTAQSFKQETIAPDGSTVVKIYYNRNIYTVTYTDGVTDETVFEDQVTENVRYGTATPAFVGSPTRTGYVFAKWDPAVAGTVTADATYTAKWTPATGTAYTVKHYQQNLEDGGYELTDTDNMSGTTGELTKAAAKVYPGFTAQYFEQKPIAPDGSTVVDIYYTRNSYTVTYQYTGTAPVGATPLPATASYKYGAVVTVADKASADGYVFRGWNLEDAEITGTFRMPAENVTLTGSFTKRTDLSYRVNYLEKGTDNVLHAQKVQNGMTFGDVVKASDETITIDGYNYDSADKENLTITTGDNVINLYYTKRTNLTATVNYYWNGTTTKVNESKTVTGLTFQQTLNESPISVAGCRPVSDASQTITIGTDGNVINFYYYKNVELTAKSKTETYNGNVQTVEGYTGAPDGVNFPGITVSASGTDAGTYDAKFADGTVNTVDATGKYIVTKATDGKLTINPAAVTVTADNKTKVFGAAEPELTATVTGTLNGDKVAYTLSRESGEAVGSYTITPTGEKIQGNYEVTYETGTLTITASGSLTVSGTDYTGTYDANAHGDAATASVTEGTTVEYQVNGGEWTTEVPKITNVGTVTVKVRATNPNYETAEDTYTLTVTPASVTVTADNKSKVYGEADPKLTATVTGTLNGDEVAYTLSRASGEAVGSYAITPTGAEIQGNYKVTYETGTLTITASGSLTVSGTDYIGTYDANAHGEAATANITDGTTISYSVDGGATWTTEFPTIKDVGTVNVTVKAENPNYQAVQNTYTLTVTPAEVTVTADNKTKVYGDADPALTATVAGVLDGAEIHYDLYRVPGEDVGSYAITLIGAVNQGNYHVTFVPGTLTVTKNGALTVTGKNYTGIYDGASHGEAATASVTEGTTISYSTDGGANWSTDFPTIKDVGTMTVTVKAENSNYQAVQNTYTLTVTPAEVTVTADNKTKVFGATEPELTATVTGTLNGDEVAYTLSRDPGEDVGDYTITPTGEANQGNYHVTFVPGTLTVTKNGTLTVTGKNYTGVYDGASHGEAATASVPDAKIEYSTDGGATWTTEFPTIKDVGTMTVTARATNPNYVTAEKTYTLTVNKRPVTLTSDTASKAYDGTPLTRPDVTVTGDGFVAGEVTDIRATGSVTHVADNEVTNTITYTEGESFKASNYTITVEEGKLSITPVAIELTADSASKPYDGTALTNNGYTITSGEFVGEEGLESVTVAGSQTLVGSSSNAITGYALKDNTAANDYTITTKPGTLTVTDRGEGEKYAITVNAKSDSKTYDGTKLTVDGFETLSFAVEGNTYTVEGLTAHAEGTNVSDSKTVPVTGTAIVKDAEGNDVTAQFTVTTKDGTLTIKKRTVTLTSESAHKEYDGTPLTRPDVTMTGDGFVTGEVTGIKATGSVTTVAEGKVKNTIVYTTGENFNADNYTITEVLGELYIETNSKTIVITANNAEKIYDGTALTDSGYTYTEGVLAEGDVLTATVEGSITNFGNADNVVTGYKVTRNGVDVTDNYNFGESGKGTLTINKRTVTLTSETASKVYDGTPLTRPNVTVAGDGFVEGEATDIRATGSILNAVDSPVTNTITFTPGADFNADNYIVTKSEGTLTITPVTEKIVVTVTGHTGTAVYDGTAHTVTGYDVAVSNPLYTAADFAFDGTASVTGTDAGGYPMGLAESQFRNASANFTEVSFVVNDGGLTVDKRPVTLSSVTDSKVYDRTPLTRSDVTVGGMGFVSGEVTDIRATGSVLNVSEGTVPNPIEFTPTAAYKAGNYTIEYHVGTLSVTPAARATVVVTGKTATFVYDGQPHTVTGFTNDGRSRDITVTLLRAGADSVTGTEINRYNMGLTAADFIASSPNYRKVDVEVVDGYLDIVTVNVNVTITVRGNRDTVTYDGSEHTVTGYEIVSITTNVGRNVTMNGLTLKLRGTASATGTEPGTYPMGLTAADFDVDTTIYRGVRVVVEDGELVIKPEAVPEAETEPTETIPDESVPMGQPDDIPDEDVPMAAPAWALLNLILSLLTVLGSLFLLSGLFGKKKEEATDENGNLILDDNGESVMNRIKQRTGWRITSLLPAIGSVIAFILTENMRNPMVLVDRWTLLMVIIAVIQVLVMMLSKKKVEETEEA